MLWWMDSLPGEIPSSLSARFSSRLLTFIDADVTGKQLEELGVICIAVERKTMIVYGSLSRSSHDILSQFHTDDAK